jgi:hypothetical protein
MQRQVVWVERQDNGAKREVRVTVLRAGVKWQFKRSTEEDWDYDSPASPADWDTLLGKMEDRYRRRTVPHAALETVRRLHEAQKARQGPGS